MWTLSRIGSDVLYVVIAYFFCDYTYFISTYRSVGKVYT